MNSILHTVTNIPKEEVEELERAYYEYEAIKELMTEVEFSTISNELIKADLSKRYVDAGIEYKKLWNKVAGSRIPIEYQSNEYNAIINFHSYSMDIIK